MARRCRSAFSVPLNEIQDGQYCLAHGLANGGTSPYDFQWSGQFSHSGYQGPLGPNQLIDGNVSASGDQWLKVVVTDSSTPAQKDSAQVTLNIGAYDYNESCEA